MEKRKILVWATAAAALAILAAGFLHQLSRAPKPVAIETIGFPSFGNRMAKVEVVVIEDFRCENCRDFSEHVFPKLKERYIDSGTIRFTLVPVAFIPGSKPIANAALEVYKRSSDRFFAYVEELFEHAPENPMDDEMLLQAAKKVGGIDLEALQECMESHCHYWELNKNLEWAEAVMGDDFGTPAVYVNGVLATNRSFKSIQDKIEKALGQKP